MLKELGCTYVIIGHSERRQYFGETDDLVQSKVSAAQQQGLLPIICVGETLAERDRNETLTVIERQVRGALQEQDKAAIKNIVIAYEPVWAIGTGLSATPAQAQEIHEAIRRLLVEESGKENAEAVRILYGGSVKPDNIDRLMAEKDIDGALVGGASLEAGSFARIVNFQ
jgi:triosephosphate isomerase